MLHIFMTPVLYVACQLHWGQSTSHGNYFLWPKMWQHRKLVYILK